MLYSTRTSLRLRSVAVIGIVWNLVLPFTLIRATTLEQIKGNTFKSSFAGATVHNVTGVVSAKDRYGIWLASEPSAGTDSSYGLRIYGATNEIRSTQVGHLISLSGRVTNYRNQARPDDLFLIEIDHPANVVVHSTRRAVKPIVIGEDRVPPRKAFSALDDGPDGWLSVPNNVSSVESVDSPLQPELYGLDFWQSLEGQVVAIRKPVALNFPGYMGPFWVHGDWPVSGKNSRGGLTLSLDDDGVPYAHSEAILIGRPLDGTRSPKSSMGMTFQDITGVLTYQFGFYTILPFTAPVVTSIPDSSPMRTSITASTGPCEITVGDYNVENMSPRSRHISRVADHIVNYLNAPDIVFVQEIQDDSGPRDDGVVSANKTLGALVSAIGKASGGIKYDFINIPPLNNVDGGKPGSNIRVAYLWRPEKVNLVGGSPVGNATQSTEVIEGKDGKLTLSYNPGRIDPSNAAWEETRKPVAATWQTVGGERFHTVNVHLSSKRDSSSSHGNARPPVNGHVERRTHQINVTATFIESLLSKDVNASIVLAGDMNEFVQTRSAFRPLEGLVYDVNEVSGVDPLERYTYVYEQRTQEIDQIFVSDAIARRGTEVEHIHVNTWTRTVTERASDHDPTVAKVKVCGGAASQSDEEHMKLIVQGPGA